VTHCLISLARLSNERPFAAGGGLTTISSPFKVRTAQTDTIIQNAQILWRLMDLDHSWGPVTGWLEAAAAPADSTSHHAESDVPTWLQYWPAPGSGAVCARYIRGTSQVDGGQ